MISEELIRETARQTLAIEEAVIAALQSSIDQDFIRCVDRIYHSKGRLIVSGIGKSALIGQKLVATLNSTGTPSFFMHAADAIHGDLGMIRPEDLVLVLSKSGETAEIKVLVPLLKQLGNPLIAMIAQRASTLGRQADFILFTPVDQEADPNNLAPTASTIAQAALGDALAMSLLALRGFSPADFALFHPGGALGKQLYLRVRDIYPQNEKPEVGPDAHIRKTIVEMTSKRLGCAVVTDTTGAVLGIITDGDLRRMLERDEDVGHLQAADIMSANPQTIEADALAVKALEQMRRRSITQLIVVLEGSYVGIIHLHDLIREGLL